MLLELKNVTFCYHPGTPYEAPAIRDLSLTVPEGCFLGILGQTGCGKTTLIQLMAGLLPPQQGAILLDGQEINHPRYDRSRLRRAVGMVFQFPEYQLFETTVERDVAFSLKHSGLPKKEIAARVQWALEQMGFSYEEIRHKSPLALSGGEKRRVAIAGVLAPRPKLLILDEPIAGLDPAGRKTFMQLLRELNQAGTTVIMVSHHADSLCEYTHRILALEDGKVLADCPTEEYFLAHPEQANVPALARQLHRAGLLPSPAFTGRQQLADAIAAAVKAGDRL